MLDQKILESVLADGISLIPVSDDTKAPFSKWKEKPNLDLIGLMDGLFRHKSSSVAMRLGLPSGRLICIDVDSKYKVGFSEVLSRGFSEVLPHLWEKVRVERTPSGGLHILYRVEDGFDMPGCGNLAERYATEKEIEDKPKSGKTRCFLEIKAEGGLSNCYPTKGYVRTHDRVIPVFSKEDHEAIIELCKSYNEVVKLVAVKSDRATFDEYYAISPFDAFDKSMAADEILEDNGWTFIRSSGGYNQYCRPGVTGKDVHGTFNTKGRYYKIHSTSAGVEPKSYTPSSLLCEIKFGGDKKQLYHWLVASGYGKLLPKIEEELVRRAAKYGTELQANVSNEGKELLRVEKEKLTLLYPYGVFWTEEEGVWKISREDLYRVAYNLGFRKWKGLPVFIDNYIIREIEPDDFYNVMKKYIKEDSVDLMNAYETFLQNSGNFTITRLEKLDKKLIFRSEKYISYKFFLNGFLVITKDTCELKPYTEVVGLILEKDIKQRVFERKTSVENSLYYNFLNNALGGFDEYARKCIGFYAHEHRDEEGYCVITSEKCEDPLKGGGNGKGIFWSLLGLTTTFKSTAADMIRTSTDLLQSWTGQKIFVMSDTDKGFNFGFFKDLITGNAVVNKKYINEEEIPIEDMPKFGASTNYSVYSKDGGEDRRNRLLEFTDFYKVHGGVRKYHGKMFPKDWTEEDYNDFDNVMVSCIQEYLKSDCVIDKKDISSGGWLKQFDQNYGHLREFIEQNIENYLEHQNIKLDKFNQDYNQFIKDNNIGIKWICSMTKINKALKDYCQHNNIEFEAHCTIRIDAVTTARGKSFKRKGTEPEEKENLPF